jgi:hypothetical protein
MSKQVIQVPLPAQDEREGLCKLYFDKTLQPPETVVRTFTPVFITTSPIPIQYLYVVFKYILVIPVWYVIMFLPTCLRILSNWFQPPPPKPKGIDNQFDNKDAKLKKLAEQTKGFSGREINKLFLSIQGSVFSSDDCVLTNEIWNNVIDWKLGEFERKQVLLQLGQESPLLSPTSGSQRQTKLLDKEEKEEKEVVMVRGVEKGGGAMNGGASRALFQQDEDDGGGGKAKDDERKDKAKAPPSKNEKQKKKQARQEQQQLESVTKSSGSGDKVDDVIPAPVVVVKKNNAVILNTKKSKSSVNELLYEVQFELGDSSVESMWCSRDELLANYSDALEAFEKK